MGSGYIVRYVQLWIWSIFGTVIYPVAANATYRKIFIYRRGGDLQNVRYLLMDSFKVSGDGGVDFRQLWGRAHSPTMIPACQFDFIGTVTTLFQPQEEDMIHPAIIKGLQYFTYGLRGKLAKVASIACNSTRCDLDLHAHWLNNEHTDEDLLSPQNETLCRQLGGLWNITCDGHYNESSPISPECPNPDGTDMGNTISLSTPSDKSTQYNIFATGDGDIFAYSKNSIYRLSFNILERSREINAEDSSMRKAGGWNRIGYKSLAWRHVYHTNKSDILKCEGLGSNDHILCIHRKTVTLLRHEFTHNHTDFTLSDDKLEEVSVTPLKSPINTVGDIAYRLNADSDGSNTSSTITVLILTERSRISLQPHMLEANVHLPTTEHHKASHDYSQPFLTAIFGKKCTVCIPGATCTTKSMAPEIVDIIDREERSLVAASDIDHNYFLERPRNMRNFETFFPCDANDLDTPFAKECHGCINQHFCENGISCSFREKLGYFLRFRDRLNNTALACGNTIWEASVLDLSAELWLAAVILVLGLLFILCILGIELYIFLKIYRFRDWRYKTLDNFTADASIDFKPDSVTRIEIKHKSDKLSCVEEPLEVHQAIVWIPSPVLAIPLFRSYIHNFWKIRVHQKATRITSMRKSKRVQSILGVVAAYQSNPRRGKRQPHIIDEEMEILKADSSISLVKVLNQSSRYAVFILEPIRLTLREHIKNATWSKQSGISLHQTRTWAHLIAEAIVCGTDSDYLNVSLTLDNVFVDASKVSCDVTRLQSAGVFPVPLNCVMANPIGNELLDIVCYRDGHSVGRAYKKLVMDMLVMIQLSKLAYSDEFASLSFPVEAKQGITSMSFQNVDITQAEVNEAFNYHKQNPLYVPDEIKNNTKTFSIVCSLNMVDYSINGVWFQDFLEYLIEAEHPIESIMKKLGS